MLSSEISAVNAFHTVDDFLPVDGSDTNHLKSTFSGATPYQQSEDIAFTAIAKNNTQRLMSKNVCVCVYAARYLYSHGHEHAESEALSFSTHL